MPADYSRDPLGMRMKAYEAEMRVSLPRRSITAIRIDGRAFHTWTKGLERPFSPMMIEAMAEATKALCEEVGGAFIGYTQSDEISILAQDFAGEATEPWFGGQVQKICSIAASVATAVFARRFPDRPVALFDARAFTLPDRIEAANYLVWRQRDCQRNAISMIAGHYFSHSELHGVGTPGRRRLLAEVGVDVESFDDRFLHGQVYEHVKILEKARYRDERTGEICETPEPVERGRWQASAAPRFEALEGSWLLERIPQRFERVGAIA